MTGLPTLLGGGSGPVTPSQLATALNTGDAVVVAAIQSIANRPALINATAPVISGPLVDGGLLTMSDGSPWLNSPTSYSYYWYRDNVLAQGGPVNTYVSPASGVITGKVIAHNSFGDSLPVSATGGGAIGVLPSWVTRDSTGNPAPMVLDAANNRGWYNGSAYGTEALFLAASGVSGVLASGVRTFGPYDVPAATNEFPGTPDLSATTALTPIQASGTTALAIVSGELELSNTTVGAGWVFSLPLARKAYRWRVKGRRGTNTGGLKSPRSGINTAMNGGTYVNSSNYPATPTTELGVIAPSASAAQRFCGVTQTNAGTGTSYFDDAVLTEVLPFSLFSQAESTIGIEGVADASGVDQVLFDISNRAAGQSGDADYVRATRLGSTGEITLTNFVGGAAVFTQSLGIIADAAALKVVLGWKDAALSVTINGGVCFTKISATQIESHATVRFGGAIGGNAWAGFQKAYYIRSKQVDPWLQFASSGFNLASYRSEGDSYPAGANGVGLSISLRAAQSKPVINTALGGTSPITQSQRLTAPENSALRPLALIFWDASPNGLSDIGGPVPYCDLIAQGLAALGHNRFVIIPPAAGGNVGSTADAVAVLSEMMARWPNNVLDWRPFIPNTGGAINSDQFQVDLTHLAQSPMDTFVTSGVIPFLTAKGW